MNYYRNNIRHCKGDTYSSGLVIEGLGQTVGSIYFTCRENLNDNASILFQSGLNNGISLVEYDEEKDIRKYAIRIAPSKTKNLQSGTYYYDLEVSVNSDVFTIMKGKFILEQDSTREDNNPDDPLILVIKNSLDEINGETISVDIIEKLDYLENTKELMKAMINDLGGDLTSTDTFRSYVDEIYNIYPKSIGEGTNITLNNTKVAKMKLETESENVSVKVINKNLFDASDFVTNVSTAFNVTNQDGVISISRSSATTYTYPLTLKENTQYSISFDFKNPNTQYYIRFSYSDNTYSSIAGETSYSEFTSITATSTASKTITGINFQLYGYANNIQLENIQLEKGTTATDYIEHQEQNITLPLAEGEYAYSYGNVTNVVSTSTVKATALMKGDE